MSLASLLVHSVTVRRVTKTIDGTDGGWTEAWNDVYFNMACRVQPLSAEEIARRQAVDDRVNCRIYFAGRPDIQFEDRLIFGNDSIEVVGVRDIDRLHKLLTIDGYIRSAAEVSASPSPSPSPSPSASPSPSPSP